MMDGRVEDRARFPFRVIDGLTPARARRIRVMVAWLLVLAAGMQFALALFFAPGHRWGGIVAALVALALLITSLRAQLDRTTRNLSVALVALVWLQGVLVALMRVTPGAGTVHSINGFVIAGLALVVALEAEEERVERSTDAPVRRKR